TALARGAPPAVGYGSTCEDVLAGRAEPRPPHVPLVSVPTTSGTGADLTGAFFGKTADGRKRAWGHSLLRGHASMLDSPPTRAAGAGEHRRPAAHARPAGHADAARRRRRDGALGGGVHGDEPLADV